jgi:hypothetical protein
MEMKGDEVDEVARGQGRDSANASVPGNGKKEREKEKKITRQGESEVGRSS